MRSLFWELVAGVTGVLAVATAIGALLGARSSGRNATIANLNQRIRAWWAMIAVMAIAIGLGNYATCLVFALLSYLTLREFITLTPTTASDHTTLFLGKVCTTRFQSADLFPRWAYRPQSLLAGWSSGF
jgi:phosphatidate cytidylyltransferase